MLSLETLCLLQDFQRVPDRKRELDAGSSSQTQGDEKMEIPEEVQAGSEQNNSSPSTGKREPVMKQMLPDSKLLMAIPAAKTWDVFSLMFYSNCKYLNRLLHLLLLVLFIYTFYLDIFGSCKPAPYLLHENLSEFISTMSSI